MPDAHTRPNILLVHWHDLGRHLAMYGVRSVQSPTLDRLAAGGLRFDRAFCTAPLCSPARGSLFTGRYPHANGLMGLAHLGWEYAPGEQTLPVLLRAAGYHTVLAGLQHESLDPNAVGFDEVVAPGGALSTTPYCGPVTDAAIAFLDAERAAERRRPFLLTVGFHEVHRPYPRDRYPPDDPATVDVPAFLPDNDWTRDDLAAFQSAIRSADAAVGRLLDAVDRTGLADDTWVIFTTDHGIAFPGAKSTLYDPGIGVALVMRLPAGWPRPHGAEGHLFSHVDLVPTVLDRLGVEVPARVQGVSHARWLAAVDPSPARSEIYAEKNFHDAYDPMRAVRTERYKYIRSFEDRPRLLLSLDIERSPTRYGFGDNHLRRRPPEELYDLHGDPLERHNLVADPNHAEAWKELAAMLEQWRVATGDPLLVGRIPSRSPPRHPWFGAIVR